MFYCNHIVVNTGKLKINVCETISYFCFELRLFPNKTRSAVISLGLVQWTYPPPREGTWKLTQRRETRSRRYIHKLAATDGGGVKKCITATLRSFLMKSLSVTVKCQPLTSYFKNICSLSANPLPCKKGQHENKQNRSLTLWSWWQFARFFKIDSNENGLPKHVWNLINIQSINK